MKPSKNLLPNQIRLHRLIALCSELSRRSAEKAIVEGRVLLNGKKVTALGVLVSPEKDHVKLDGKSLQLPRSFSYVAFYKPPNMLVTRSDPEGRDTIWKLLERWEGRLNTAGRLDFDSEGLLILSDDGALLHALMHPSHELWKTYRLKVQGLPSPETLRKLKEGIKLEDGPTLPSKWKLLKAGDRHAWLEASLREGRNRQLRRMCEAVGHPLMRLKRVAVGPITLGDLTRGKWRFLTPAEVKELKSALIKAT
ncbi:MAG: hypothetical protein A3I05_09420 [Deltaproteobacteria bacterium RIFCSPLOWO2_02_FULL_44_10]|nr:MAG: hypothetical protein A3C46_07560 [Deltaproteobacteria bacterium RIFCSPHIGHO2_02_FULL_44_16]OGQ47431.1 MAG: hypothetical protein A3I05_09420 [Deltaproteobacteria bacterium RIFCSPLOWO2_02_FULL_44_10]